MIDIFDLFDENNNRRKYIGKPMLRRVHLLKLRNKRIVKTQEITFDLSQEFIRIAHSAMNTTITLKRFMELGTTTLEED